MNPTDKLKFNIILTDLADIYDAELSDRKVDGYFEALKDLSLDDIVRATGILKQTTKFFPKPVEFREIILPDLETQASLAYERVLKAFWGIGQYHSVTFDDRVIHAVIDSLGGWQKYCNTPDSELKWYRKDFERLYIMYAPQIDNMEVATALHGIYSEAHNATLEAKEPKMIGDVQKILEWTGKEQKALKEGMKELDVSTE